MKILIIEIDSAASMAEIQLTDEAMRLTENEQYKYLSFFPLQKNCHKLWPVCSKDLKEWTICAGATKDGQKLDLINLTAMFEELLDNGKIEIEI